MYISELIKKDKKELGKMSKAEIIETILNSKWQWESNINNVKDAEQKLVKQSEGEKAVKLMLIGYLDKPVERNEYSGEIDGLHKISLVELVGELMVKAARY